MNDSAGLSSAISRQGSWLYHRRSYVGVVMLPLLILALWYPGFPGNLWRAGQFDHLSECGLLISIAGLALRWFTVGWVPADTSVRSNRELRAAALNTTGMYSVVRHPLYLANGIVLSGLVIAFGSAWLLAVFAPAYALYVERVAIAEERFIEGLYANQWRAWASTTPAFIPNLRLWQPSALGFSARTVLRREYNGVFGASVAFFALEYTRDVAVKHQSLHMWIARDGIWSGLLVVGLVTLLVLRTLKRHSRVLHVKGR